MDNKDKIQNVDSQVTGDDISDTRGPAIVIRGSVVTGFQFYGPFNTIDDAAFWCRTTVSGQLGVNNDVIELLKEPTKDCW